MLKLLLSAVLTLGAITVQAQSLPARSLTAPSVRDVGFISQDFQLGGTTNSEFSVAPLTVSNQGYGTRKLSTKLPSPPIKTALPVPVGNPSNQADVMKEAGYWMNYEFEPMKARIAGWLRSRGIAQTYYTYRQEVMVNTAAGPRKKMLTLMAVVEASGRATHGTLKLVDADPVVVEALYTPLQAAEGLPPDWKFPNAGTLRYRLLNQRFVELTGWKTIDVGGVYDNPEQGDPLARVPCLVDRTYDGCGQPTTTVRDVIEQEGGSYALLSYVRRIEPYYDESASGDNMTPNNVMSVDQRIWNCAAMIHRGSFGMEVALQSDQFLVQPSEPAYEFRKVGEQGGRSLSPTTSYEVSASKSDIGGYHPEQVILAPLADPNVPESKFWPISDAERMKGVVYVAPLTIESGMPTGFVTSSDVSIQEVYNSGAVKEYLIGTVGNNYWGGSYYPYDRTVTFNIAHPDSTQEAALTELGYDDWLMVQINGHTIYIGPYGGDMLDMGGKGAPQGVEANCNYVTPESWLENSYWQCYIVKKGWGKDNYDYVNTNAWVNCTQAADGKYYCNNSCSPYQVQYLTNANGMTGQGCGGLELGQQWRYGGYWNLKPYLVAGTNHLFIRTIVGGKGEMWVRLRIRGCSLN